MSNFSLDTKDFDMKFDKLVNNAIPRQIEKGLFNAAAEMLRDADNEIPKTPFKEGHLRGSKKIAPAVKKSGEISVKAGFNIGYAARLHEMEKTKADRTNWSLPGSGPKFLESKMVRNKRKYMGIVAETIKGGS